MASIQAKARGTLAKGLRTLLILRFMMDSAAKTLSPTADSSMFTSISFIFFLSTFTAKSRQTIILNFQPKRHHFFAALLWNYCRWNGFSKADWLGSFYVTEAAR